MESLKAMVTAGLERLSVATREAYREAKRRQQRLDAKRFKRVRKAGLWEIRCGDCLAELRRIKTGSAGLVFADPPYNQGVDYGRGAKADRLSDERYGVRVVTVQERTLSRPAYGGQDHLPLGASRRSSGTEAAISRHLAR